MAEYAALQPCIKMHMPKSCIRERVFLPMNPNFRIAQSKHFHGSCKAVWLSTSKVFKLSTLGVSSLKVIPCLREAAFGCSCLGSFVNFDGATASNWVPLADQVLLVASICLTYMAGVVPVQKSYLTSPENTNDDNVVSESSNSSGSASNNDAQVSSSYAWDVVKAKILDSLDAIEHRNKLGNKFLEFEEQRAKRPLSLYAVAESPRLRLLWASFQRLEDEVQSISGNLEFVDTNEWLAGFSEIIRNCCGPICRAWLEKEPSLGNSFTDEALVSLLFEKLKGDATVLRSIKNTGKEELYAELLRFLRFGSTRDGCLYDYSLFSLHGVSILEDLVITVADIIASICLELISVDGNLSKEMNTIGVALCNLSTRELQRLRNEVALDQWLHQNMEAIVSMFEDRFDLCTLQSHLIEEPNQTQTEKFGWWKKLAFRKSETELSPLRYTVISHFSMPVKRTRELRALTGWRYYFSLFLELSDISMPMIKVIIEKVSNAISFFLVCLIGRSLGLIYTGIRQSLRWK